MTTPSTDLCQQPRPDVCPLCGNCVTCSGERVVEGSNANAGTWSRCQTCTDKQPAQPGSGEVVPRSRYDACNRDWLEEKAAHERTRDAAANEIDRLQSALTAARQRIAELESENADLRARLNHSERLQGRYPRDAS